MNINEINKQLNELNEIMSQEGLLERKIKQAKSDLDAKDREVKWQLYKLQKEQKDVDQITHLSFKSVLASLKGNKDEQIDKETQELLEATSKLDNLKYEANLIKEELEEYEYRLNNINSIRGEYEELMKQKARFLLESSEEFRSQYNALNAEVNLAKEQLAEILEAITAGKNCVRVLEKALEHFTKAEHLGEWDTWSKNSMFTSIRKHDHIHEANEYISLAQKKLQTFNREMQDVSSTFKLQHVQNEYIDEWADIWFDNFFTDRAVQNQIRSAISKLSRNLGEINGTIHRLTDLQKDNEKIIVETQSNIEQLINDIQ
jgi:chromosome segregation ATPase